MGHQSREAQYDNLSVIEIAFLDVKMHTISPIITCTIILYTHVYEDNQERGQMLSGAF